MQKTEQNTMIHGSGYLSEDSRLLSATVWSPGDGNSVIWMTPVRGNLTMQLVSHTEWGHMPLTTEWKKLR